MVRIRMKTPTKKYIRHRLSNARALLTADSKRAFGKGRYDMANNRYVSEDGTWALQWHSPSSTTGDLGQVRITKL